VSTLGAILAFLQEEHAEHGGDKTPFYAAGGLLAAWAVLVAGMGITKHDFPSSAGAARGVMALTAVLVLGAMASAVITS
jgi:hypothetical protein